jgi:hypothetical protein
MLQSWDNHTSEQIKFTTGFIPGKLNHFNPWQIFPNLSAQFWAKHQDFIPSLWLK